ncbi:MAG: LytR C-terminal domain-containing protein [Candidatus Kapabacteria bacterium]|nr:LytR C-terminal domain-containing protein [Candidatus Kapabacteria bacterium]
MDFKDKKSIINYSFISVLSLVVFFMGSSLVYRVAIAKPVDPNLDRNIQKSTVTEVIQVNILNACGERGLASKVKSYLRARGFDVVEVGNFSKTLDKSVIYDRVGDLQSAKKVAYAVGINDSLVASQLDSSLFLRTSIVIGKDFKELKPFN